MTPLHLIANTHFRLISLLNLLIINSWEENKKYFLITANLITEREHLMRKDKIYVFVRFRLMSILYPDKLVKFSLKNNKIPHTKKGCCIFNENFEPMYV